jgi:hypothetical protein
MTITQNFFIDVLKLFIKDNLYCDLQSSCDNLIKSIKQFDKAVVIGDYSAYFPLNETNKKILIDNIMLYHSEEYMHHFEIKENDRPLFMAHDGFEIAEIVSEITLSENFIEKYVRTNLCIVWDKIIYPQDQLQYGIRPNRIML